MAWVNVELVIGNNRFSCKLDKDFEPVSLIWDIVKQFGLPEGNYRLILIGDTGIQDGATLKLETVEADIANVPLPENSQLLACETIIYFM